MTISWKAGVNGLFETASDWSGGAVPGASDDVLLGVPGTYAVTMDQSESVNSLRIGAAGATFAEGGSGVTLTVATTLSIAAGTLALAMDSSNANASIDGGTLVTSAGGVLAATMGAGNEATYFDINAAVNLAGKTTIAGGYLELGGGGALTGSVSGTGELDLDEQAYTAKAGIFSGLAALGITGGTLNLGATSGVLAPYLVITESGTLNIASSTAITLTSARAGDGPLGAVIMETTENQISGAGTLVSTGFEVADAGSQTDDLIIGGGLTWLNQGTVTDDGIIAMNTSGNDTVTILNAAGATFDFEGLHAGLIDHGSTGADILSNQGTLEKTAGDDSGDGDRIVTVAAAVINLGLVDVQAGTLALTGGGAIGGTLSGAGTLLLYSGSYTVGSLSGPGHLSVGTGASVTYDGGTITTAYTLDGNQTLAISAGETQTLSGPFMIGDASGGGTIAGPGTLVTSGATTIADLAGTQALALNGSLVWTNSGTVSEAGLVASSGAALTNSGTFDFTSDNATFTGSGASDTFRNTGTLGKTAGTGISLMSDVVTSTGSIAVASGALVLAGGGSVSGVLTGAGALHLEGGVFTTTGLSGGGTLAIDDLTGAGYGTLTASANATVGTAVRLDSNATIAAAAGKILTFSGPLAIDTVESAPSPDGGNLTGPGTITTTGATTVGTATNGYDYPAISLGGGVTWVNSATGTVTDAGAGSSSGGTIRNAGVFNFAADPGGIAAASTADVFINTGTLGKTAETGSSLVTDVVTSTGTINVATGALVLGGGGAVSGVLNGAGALHLSNGAFTTTGISGAGNLVIDNLVGTGYGTLTATAGATITAGVRLDGNATLGVVAGKILTLTGALAINTVESTPSPDGGNFAGLGTITTTGATTIGTVTNGYNYPAISLDGGVTWVNSATGTVTDAGAGSSSGGTIRNAGVFNFAGDTGGIAAASAADAFINTGTLGKTGGTGSSLVTDVVASTGTISVATGALVLGGGGAVSGVLNGAGALHLSNGAFTTAGISGSGSLVVDNLVGTGYGTLTASTTATITASVRVDGNAVIGATLGKTLTLTGPVAINTVESTPSPDGGNFAGLGTITTTGATTIGTATNGYNNPALTLEGGITWINAAGGTVSEAGTVSSNGGILRNAGVFTFTADTGGIAAASAGDVFVNTGTLGKNGGTGSSVLTDAVTSTGTINVATGALVLGGGGAISGVLNGAGALHLGNGSFTTTGLTGAGNLVIDNLVGAGYGALTASASCTIATAIRIDGNATLAVASGDTLTLLNQLTINTVESAPSPDGGTFAGAGSLVTDNLVTIGAVTNGYNNPALALAGGITWLNPSTVNDAGLIASNNATIVNSGNFMFTADTGGISAAGAADMVINTGLLAKTGGTGDSAISSSVSNTGTIEAGHGTLSLADLVGGTGTLKIDAGATLDVAGALPASQKIVFTGGAGATLEMRTPASIGTLTGFGAGDRLDLASTVSAASISGTTLTVTTGAGVFTYVSAGLAGGVAAISGDSNSGSFVAIYRAATAAHSPEPLAFGNHHVGDTAGIKLALTVSNTDVADGYSEKLNAALGGATAGFTAAGSVAGIAAGASNSTSLSVTLDTSTAGAKTGTARLALVSSGAGVDGRAATALPSQTVNLTGAVYAYAAAHLASTAITLANQHVGSSAATFLAVGNSAASGGYSESLDASFIGHTGNATGSGTVAGIAAGATSTTGLSVGLTAATGGVATGTDTLAFVSDGAGSSGLGTTSLGTQAVSLTGTFYNLAAAHLAASTISLGIIHAGTAATATLALTNGAAAGGYSEALDAGLSGASTGLTTAGSVTGLAAGATDASSLLLTVDTTASGAYSGSATLGLVSDGAGSSGLGTTVLGSQTVSVSATVDNYALAGFTDPSGPAITGSSTSATINLGSMLQGSAALTLHLGAQNAASGTADLLIGTISTAGGTGFTNSGFGALGAALSAGQSETAQTISLATTTAGIFTETVLLSTAGTNASGYDGTLATETLTITGTITPSAYTTYTLALGPNTITGADGKGDLFVAASGALNSRDRLTGGNGLNSITLAGAGVFDVNAPVSLINIPTINAHEGQSANGTHANTAQTVLMRDGATETLNVAAGIPASGDAAPETIAIYGGTGTDTIRLATGTDQVFLGTGTDSITLGGAGNSVAAGGGTAIIHATAAFAGASIVGTTSGSTTLALSTAGTAALNATDTHLTVQLSGASMLTLDALSFITAIGSAGADTLVAGAAGQTLTGGLGADTLVGAMAGGDLFADTAAGLNRDTIGNWTTGDQIDVRDIANATAVYQAGTLTIGGGSGTTIMISGSYSQGNFVVLGSDGAGGTVIGYHG